MSKSIHNFSPGPSKMPAEVLQKIQDEMISFQGMGISILEMSHRSPQFTKVLQETEALVRELLVVPENYRILFLQGGATGQFAAVPLNLINRNPSKIADYVVTGLWSSKAVSEAKKYGNIKEVFPRMKTFTNIPNQSSWNLDPNASYLYYCSNETVHGVEFSDSVESHPDVPVVCDMSSNIFSKAIPVSKFGLIFASSQKNLGCSGVTLVIVRDDLLNFALSETPTVLNFKIQNDNSSLYNTPPMFSIYTTGLVLQWMKDHGGVEGIEKVNHDKASLLYKCIEESEGFYRCPVEEPFRSRANVVFRIETGNEELEKNLASFAKSNYNIIEIKGHRSVGGMRVSLYNSITLQSVEVLVQCLKAFRQQTIQSRA